MDYYIEKGKWWLGVAGHYVMQHTQETAIVVALVAALLMILVAWREKTSTEVRGVQMTRKEREAYQREVLSELLCDVLEDCEYRGLLTRNEVNNWYRKFAKTQGLELRNLLPRRNAKRELICKHGSTLTRRVRKLSKEAFVAKIISLRPSVKIQGPSLEERRRQFALD